MPAGPTIGGFAYFLGVKWIGYSLFCKSALGNNVVQKEGDYEEHPSFLAAGAIRTLVGIAVGAVVGLGFWSIPAFSNHEDLPIILFFTLLVPVRVLEWRFLLRWPYKDRINPAKRVKLVALGVVTSFLLDAIGMVTAMIMPGGIWVC